LVFAAALLFSVPTSWAGAKWLEQCHGLPVFTNWNHYGNQCHPTHCTASQPNFCGVTSKYAAYPITSNSVPENIRIAAGNALLGPLVTATPKSGQFIAPDFPGTGKVTVQLHGPAPTPPDKITLSFERNNGGGSWAEYFPSVGETLHLPIYAKRTSSQSAGGITAVYK